MSKVLKIFLVLVITLHVLIILSTMYRMGYTNAIEDNAKGSRCPEHATVEECKK